MFSLHETELAGQDAGEDVCSVFLVSWGTTLWHFLIIRSNASFLVLTLKTSLVSPANLFQCQFPTLGVQASSLVVLAFGCEWETGIPKKLNPPSDFGDDGRF